MASRRTDRDLARGRRAAALVQSRGGTALDAACAHIAATFSPAMHHSVLKDRVARLMAGGAGHPEVWSRYRDLAERHPLTNLAAALALLERLRDSEREARATAIATWGHSSRPRLVLMMLDELRLILRVVRRYAPASYPSLIAITRNRGECAIERSQAAE
jgi:hypothetical protein